MKTSNMTALNITFALEAALRGEWVSADAYIALAHKEAEGKACTAAIFAAENSIAKANQAAYLASCP